MQFGPDERLYVAQQDGTIYAYTIVRNGANDYLVTDTETINTIKNEVANHNDDGSSNSTNKRQVTGILVTGTPQNPVLYVTSSDSRIKVSEDSGLDTNSGVISRLTCTGGISGDQCQSWERVDIVRGLPRSEENHSTNGMDLDEANNILYVMSGGHANKGSPSDKLSGTPEYYLSAAMLRVDLNQIAQMESDNGGPFTDPRTGDAFVYDLPTLNDPTRTDLNPGDAGYPYSSGHPWYGNPFDTGDPFGGNNGLNQAIPEPNGPVQIHSPGYRNAYDVVFTQSGDLYTWDNGPNSGWGGTALIYDVNGNLKGHDNNLYNAGTGDYCTNEFNENGSNGHGDVLKLVTQQGYYGGHQTPIRAFPSRAGIYNYIEVSNGNWQQDPNLPVYQMQDLVPPWLLTEWGVTFEQAFPDNPIECEYTADDDDLEKVSASTNGLTEYTASNFDGAMQGDLLAASFNENIYRCKPDGQGGLVDLSGSTSGTDKGLCEARFSGFGSNPLDVTAQGDGEIFAGTVWAATYGGNNITVFEPTDFGACDTSDPNGDPDNDGYTTQDEQDNDTNPCSNASKPTDFDGDLVSDLNDTDDDNDGILDVNDPFAIDADNGTSTELPLFYSLFNNDPGTGLFGLGFTGLMIPEDGSTHWLQLFDAEKLAAGGTAGLLTVEEVSSGDAYENNNSQEYGFLFGVDVDSNSAPFVVSTRLLPPYFEVGGSASTPQNFQSFGLFIGTGDQDNYLKIVFNANGGSGGIEVLTEVDGNAGGNQYGPDFGGTNILNSGSVDLYLVVDPSAATVQPQIALDEGQLFNLGSPLPVPSSWFTPNDGQGLAVGAISTSFNSGTPFGATWDFFEVAEVPADSQAIIEVTPSGGINASTFGSDSFQITNSSSGGQNITSLTLDLSSTILPDIVFDPNGTAGDQTAKGFSADSGSADVGYTTSQLSGFHNGTDDGDGFDILTVDFNDFNPNETFGFSIDIDPTSIKGTSAPGPGQAGSVSGFELTGATVTAEFSDGTSHTAALFHTEGSDSGAENIVRNAGPAKPTIEMLNINAPEVVFNPNQTVRIDAPIDATVRLLRVEGGMFEQSGGGYDVDPFEANTIVAWEEYSDQIGSTGAIDIPVTLTKAGPESGLNYFVAVVEDSDGMTGPVSNPIVVDYDPNAAPTPVALINAGGLQYTDTSNNVWSADANFSGGSTFAKNGLPIANTEDDTLYQTERYGTFSYNIPLSNGSYLVELHFAEIYHGSAQSPSQPGASGARVFDVSIEGTQVLDNYDIYDDVGADTAVVKSFSTTVNDSALDISFTTVADNAKVSAIAVYSSSGGGGNVPPAIDPVDDQVNAEGDTPTLTIIASDPDSGPENLTFSASGLPTGLEIEPTNGHVFGTIADGAAANSPYNVTVTVSDGEDTDNESFSWTVTAPPVDGIVCINAGDQGSTPYTAISGRVFQPDQYFNGGIAWPSGGPKTGEEIANTTDDFLYQTERSAGTNLGTFSYEIPVANGDYTLDLYFAEIYFGASVNPKGGVGSDGPGGERVFSIDIENGQASLTDYDINADVGPSTAVLKSYNNISVSDEVLNLDFSASVNQPKISALCVVPEQQGTRATLNGTVTREGRSDHAGDLAVTFYETGSSTVAGNFTVQSDSSGAFTIDDAPVGTYDVAVKSANTLQVMATLTFADGQTTTHDFGEMPTGDANNDNQVSALDFSLLVGTYNLAAGDANYDARADFNGDNQVSALDFSLLASNYNTSGQAPAATANNAALRTAAKLSTGELVTLRAAPNSTSVQPGELVEVTLLAETITQTVDTVSAVLDYDPSSLELVEVSGGTALNTELASEHDAAAGTVRYEAGRLEGTFPNGSFAVARLIFRARAVNTTTALTFMEGTAAYRAGASILGAAPSTTLTVTSIDGQALDNQLYLPVIQQQ